MPISRTAYERIAPWRRPFEAGFWVVVLGANAVANTLTTQLDARAGNLDMAAWEPVVWEGSSNLVWLALIPAIAAFSRRYPVQWQHWPRRVAAHVAASIVVCLLHVGGMIALRQMAYQALGHDYAFGEWPARLSYEYLKDVRSYALMLACIEFYRLALRRMQGEVHLLAAPDEGLPVEPIERPSRFLVRKVGREFLVAADDVEWLQAWGNYVNLRVRGHDYPWRGTISGIEAWLDPARFLRVHRSYIVNLEHVASIEPLDSGDARVHLKDGAVVPCSRRYRNRLRECAGVASAGPG